MENKKNLPVEQAKAEISSLTMKIGTLKIDLMKAINSNGDILNRCLTAGERLLSKVESMPMNDNLDEEISLYIEGAKKAYKMMGDARKPQTQVLDLLKKGFTTMENMVYIKNSDSVVYMLQKKRDEYALLKLQEQRKAEEERQRQLRAQQERTSFASDAAALLDTILSESIYKATDDINTLFSGITLENKDANKRAIETYSEELSLTELFVARKPACPPSMTDEECKAILNKAYRESKSRILSSYADAVHRVKENLLMMYDSRVAELEKAARLSEEERKNAENNLLKADKLAFEAQKKALEKDAEARDAVRAMNAAGAEAADLFAQANVITPVKAKVKKAIEVKNKSGWKEIIMMWWTYEGVGLDMEKLETKLGFMKRSVEREVNKQDLNVESDNLNMIDDVTAK